ncbi:hypothetical protein D6C98_10807 [Aureobasidium pullulans]|nr:hypothetical protein D6C98_10807 [Aureobasidium pullulans]
MSPIDEQPIYADVLGQWPQLKTYNHGSALYKAINILREEIIREWELIERVVHNGITTGNTGRFYTAPWPTDLPPNKLLRFKDCTELLPGY